jgi:hypothetical protein
MKKPYPHQKTAIDSLNNGSVLVGGTGSGKSLVSLGYYFEKVIGGSMDPPLAPIRKTELIVITTARKRDDRDWEKEALSFGISTDPEVGVGVKFKVDSWNNIKNYVDLTGAFFIFDEQRSGGGGGWSKAFIKICKQNQWILATATPADRWIDLIPVFIANRFYENRTSFIEEHVIYAPYTTFPKIKGYRNIPKLNRNRDRVFVVMPFVKKTISNIVDVKVEFDKDKIDEINTTEWNPFKDAPIKNLSEHTHVIRRILNSHHSRIEAMVDIHARAKKLIIFYNFNYELEILKVGFEGTTEVAEYNGKKHQDVPTSNDWVYLVQYTSGSEAWECFTTNHMAFYSMNYSYRVTIQAMGRINRLTTSFENLFYYRLLSDAHLDAMILKAFGNKKKFNVNNLKPRVTQLL